MNSNYLNSISNQPYRIRTIIELYLSVLLAEAKKSPTDDVIHMLEWLLDIIITKLLNVGFVADYKVAYLLSFELVRHLRNVIRHSFSLQCGGYPLSTIKH